MQSKAQLRRAQHIVLKTSAYDDRRATVGDHTTICLTSKMASMWCRWLASNVGKVERALIVTRGFRPHQATNNDGFDDEGIGKSRDRDRISHSRAARCWTVGPYWEQSLFLMVLIVTPTSMPLHPGASLELPLLCRRKPQYQAISLNITIISTRVYIGPRTLR